MNESTELFAVVEDMWPEGVNLLGVFTDMDQANIALGHKLTKANRSDMSIVVFPVNMLCGEDTFCWLASEVSYHINDEFQLVNDQTKEAVYAY